MYRRNEVGHISNDVDTIPLMGVFRQTCTNGWVLTLVVFVAVRTAVGPIILSVGGWGLRSVTGKGISDVGAIACLNLLPAVTPPVSPRPRDPGRILGSVHDQKGGAALGRRQGSRSPTFQRATHGAPSRPRTREPMFVPNLTLGVL